MTLIRLLLLAIVSQLRGCFLPLCEAVGGREPQSVSTRTSDRVLVDAALIKDGDLIVDMAMSYTPPEYHHNIVRVDETYGPEELARYQLTDYFGSGVTASGDSWWYSLAGGRGEKGSAVFFRTPEERVVETGLIFAGEWVPFDQAEPRGLLIADVRKGLQAMEITPGGVLRRWSLPLDNAWAIGARDAQRLPDGAIALVAFRHDTAALHLLILDQGEPVVVLLRENLKHVRLTTALASDGMLAVVLESNAGELEAAVFDPHNPGQLRWQLLTPKDEPGRNAAVIFHEGKFIAAWSAPGSHELRARTFTAERPGPLATIAPLLSRGNRIPSISIFPDGEELLFVWQEDGVMSRRVPAEFAGFSFVDRLCKLCY